MKVRIGIMAVATLAFIVALAAPAQTPRAQEGGAALGSSYTIDPVHSTVVFRIKHLGVSHFYGRFNGPTGTVAYDPDDPASASFEIAIEAEKVDTGNGQRDDHLRSPDFFNARQFKTITFRSTKVEKKSDSVLRVSGNLSMHGRTRPLVTDISLVGCGESPRFGYRCGFHASFTVKRSDFGMDTYVDNGMLGDEVTLWVGLEVTR